LRSDVGLSSEILRRANSARYGLRSQVSSLHHAIMLLGFDHLKGLAITAAMGTYLKAALKIASLRRCWRHTMACALLAEELSKLARLESDQAYTAGLLHDIGLLGLMVNFPQEYATMILVTQEHSFGLLDVERDLFDVDHCEAGAWLAGQWGLPQAIIDAAGLHHQEPAAEEVDNTGLIQCCCRLASCLGFELVTYPEMPTYADVHARLPEKLRSCISPDSEALRYLIESRVDALE
jgi:putative nucleotidyltransferase with HDIG domain